jgi:ribonuclease Z
MSVGVRLAGIDVEAVSVGGLETCIQLPGYDLCFDIGRCPRSATSRSRVLLTHTHMDHASGLAYHAATRDLLRARPPTYYVPRENHADLLALWESWKRLDRSDLPCAFVPCGPGDSIPLSPQVRAIPFRSPHRVPCQGYALLRDKRRLKPELAGLPEDEIRRRRVAGEDVSEAHSEVEFAFTGDSVIDVVEREAMVRTARLLVMEVTFLDGRVSVEKAREKGHIHLDEVVERAQLFENRALLFTHFSARYAPGEIVAILDRRLPPGLRERVTPLLPGRA